MGESEHYTHDALEYLYFWNSETVLRVLTRLTSGQADTVTPSVFEQQDSWLLSL